MKKLICTLSFAVVVALGFEASAQCTPQNLAEPGLSPADDSLECVVQGAATDVTIYFKNFDTISGVTVEWLKIDRLDSLPTGLSYCLNDPDFQYNSAENGCIRVTGTTNDPVGQYKLGIFVTLKVSILPQPVSGEAGALSAQFGGPPFDYFIRVKANAGDPCTPIDTLAKDNLNGGTASSVACATGINDLYNVGSFSVTPNPVRSTTEISFSLDKVTDVKLVIYNSIGQRVYHKDVKGTAGSNVVTVDRGNLQRGLYMVGLEKDGKSLISKQLMME